MNIFFMNSIILYVNLGNMLPYDTLPSMFQMPLSGMGVRFSLGVSSRASLRTGEVNSIGRDVLRGALRGKLP